MKIKDFDFSKYVYTRICLEGEHGPEFFPHGTEDALNDAYGECDIDCETGVSTDEDGIWLTVKIIKAKEEDTGK